MSTITFNYALHALWPQVFLLSFAKLERISRLSLICMHVHDSHKGKTTADCHSEVDDAIVVTCALCV